LEEGKKHHPEKIALKAERSGNGFKLSGSKQFVVHGQLCRHADCRRAHWRVPLAKPTA
jgi:hypothetical protein